MCLAGHRNDSTRTAGGGDPAAGAGFGEITVLLTVLYRFVPFQPMFRALAREERLFSPLPWYRHGRELPTRHDD
eukprot:7243484-Prymnesium_polylepis.1